MEELFKAKTQDRFLALAYQYYNNKINNNDVWWVSRRNDIKGWLYKLGRDYNILNMDFLEFEKFLIGKHEKYHKGRWYKTWRYCRWSRAWGHNCPPEQWRVLRGFTFTGQAKKSKEDSPQQTWRKHKKFKKDKNQARYWGNWKKNLKHFGAKKHRMMERMAIASDKVDNLGANSYKEAENPWSWD